MAEALRASDEEDVLVEDGDAWLADLFPREKGLARLGRGILDAIDDLAFLPAYAWHRYVDCAEFERSARETTIKTLIRRGLVDVRSALVSGRERRIYVRSERYAVEFYARNREFARYRSRFSWWTPQGPLTVRPLGGRSRVHDRDVDQVGGSETGRNNRLPTPARKELSAPPRTEDLEWSSSDGVEHPSYGGHKPVETRVFDQLASLMNVSVEEAEMYGQELAEGYRRTMKRSVTPAQAARGYLRFKNWNFKTWQPPKLGEDAKQGWHGVGCDSSGIRGTQAGPSRSPPVRETGPRATSRRRRSSS